MTTLAVPDPATTHWVPVGPGPMPDFRYKGDFVVATSYADGDIVVYGGVTYLCVTPTSSAPTPWLPPSISPTYGTALPASPVDGMEHVLVDSTTNPGYQWRFRYNAASTSAYKWEFIGGPPFVGSANSFTNSTVGSYVPARPPSFTIPRAGEWIFGFNVQFTTPASVAVGGVYNVQASMWANGAGGVAAAIYYATYSGDTLFVLGRDGVFITCPAGDVVSPAIYVPDSRVSIGALILYVTPKRVS